MRKHRPQLLAWTGAALVIGCGADGAEAPPAGALAGRAPGAGAGAGGRAGGGAGGGAGDPDLGDGTAPGDAGDPGGGDPAGGDLGDGDGGAPGEAGPEADSDGDGAAPASDLPGVILPGPIRGATITSDSVLDSDLSPYLIEGVVQIAGGARLSVEPGTVIRMGRGAAILVGTGDDGGALVAIGTEDAPITFTSASATPQAGDWGLLGFLDKTDDAATVLRHVVVEYAGQPDVADVGGRRSAAIVAVGARPALSHVTVRRFRGKGVELVRGGGAGLFQDNTFAQGDGAPLSVGAGRWADIGPGHTFADPGAYVEITGGVVEETFEVAALSVPYRVTGDVGIRGEASPVLHVPAGATFHMGPGTSIDVGGDELMGGLVARGVDGAPITFRSASGAPDPGDWGGIAFHPRAIDDASVLENVVIAHAGERNGLYAGGYHTASVAVHGARPHITATAVTDGGGAGVLFVDADSGAAEFAHNVFRDLAGASIRIPAPRTGDIGAPNTFDGPADAIEVTWGRIEEDMVWPALGAPWRIIADLPIDIGAAAGATLTVEPGARVEVLRTGGGLRAGGAQDSGIFGAIVAVGTRERPIVFTSADRANPAAGDWGGLLLRRPPAGITSTLQHVVVEYGGAADWVAEGDDRYASACVAVADARVAITSTTIRRCGGGAVDALDDLAGFTAFDGNTFADNGGDAVAIGAARSADAGLGAHSFQGQAASNHILVRGGVIGEDTTWSAVGAPWRVRAGDLVDVGAPGAATLTVTAGATVEFGPGAGLRVGAPELGVGDLVALGEAGRPVLFTSGAPLPARGDWRGILLDTNVRDGVSGLHEFVVEYGGSVPLLEGARSSNLILNDNAVELSRGRVRTSAGVGIWIVGGEPTLDDIAYDGNRDGDWVRAL